jgi:DNA-binding transcriptional ArsR family regulator
MIVQRSAITALSASFSDTETAAAQFAALSGAPRLRMLVLVADKALACEDAGCCDLSERCCNLTELAAAVGVSKPTASHHLKELRRAGLIRTHRRGRTVYCELNAATLRGLARRLDALAAAETRDALSTGQERNNLHV